MHRNVLVLLMGACAITNAHASINHDPSMPNIPGVVRTTDRSEICSTGTKQLRHWSRERDDRILTRDGYQPGPHPLYEIDHLVPLGIGGDDDDNNLWVEPRGGEWGAEKKDRLEWRMRDLICKYGYEPGPLQDEIADDWKRAYKKYLGE